ncbi:hypothetical protein AAF712_007303 [Marasmius tenuissimus]|uniref:Uncharacterized protein n=1 Tax=Marasmius tenuissimus TaxID=585030 RepID=A0ABR2ZX77_9AGAR
MPFSAALLASGHINDSAMLCDSQNQNISLVVASPNAAIVQDRQDRSQFRGVGAAASKFNEGRQNGQERKLRRTRALAPSPAHNVAVVHRMDGDYLGQVAEIEFGDACYTYETGSRGKGIKRFQLEETEEYEWLMSVVATEELELEDDLSTVLDAFRKPPSFAANNKTDKKSKRHGVIFDFPKAQIGADCGKWW